MCAGIGRSALVAHDACAAQLGRQVVVRAVVGGKDEYRVAQQAKGFQAVLQAAHDEVRVGHHVLKVALLVLRRPVFGMRSRQEGRMHKHHREVGEERLVLVRLDEVEQELGENVGPVIVFGDIDDLAVAFDRRVPEAPALRVPGVPQAIRVEAVARRHSLRIRAPLQLPFARNSRGVTGLAEQVGDTELVGQQRSEISVVADVAHARHQGNAARGAERRRKAVREANPAIGKLVDPRRGVLAAAVRTETFVADVVRHHQHDIGRPVLA